MPALVSSQFAPLLLRELQKFRNEHFLCDCKLVVSVSDAKETKDRMDENESSPNAATLEFPAHRLVLSAGSAFFWDLFNLRRHESMTTVNLNNCSPECLEVVLHFLYSGELQLGGCNPQTVLNVAKVFQIHSLEQMLSPLAVSTQADGRNPVEVKSEAPQTPVSIGSKRKYPLENGGMDERHAATASPGILKRLCQKHSLLSCAYCLPMSHGSKSDDASDASGPYVPTTSAFPPAASSYPLPGRSEESLEIQAAQAQAQFQMAFHAAAMGASTLAYHQALSGAMTSLPSRAIPSAAMSFSPQHGTKSTSLSGGPISLATPPPLPTLTTVVSSAPTRAGYIGPVLPTRSVPTSVDHLLSPTPAQRGLMSSPIFPPMVAANNSLPSPYLFTSTPGTPLGIGSGGVNASPRPNPSKMHQHLLATVSNSPGSAKMMKRELQGKPTVNQGVTAAFTPDQTGHHDQKSPSFEDSGIMVPSNDKEGWCRNKKYIEKVTNGFKCTVCQKVYGRYNSVSYHVTIYHRNPPIRCDEPGCQFTTREARYIHFHKYYRHGTALPKTIDLAPRSCPFCRHVAKSPAMLEKHINRHVPDAARGAKGFKCRDCGKELPTQRAMLEHMAAHTEEKTHQCDQCSYKGRTESNLRQHILFKHSSDLFKRKFVCDRCDYYCPTEGNLDAHKRRVHKLDIPRKRDKLGEPLYDDDLEFENEEEDIVDSDLSPEPEPLLASPLSVRSLALPRICEQESREAASLTESALHRSFKLPKKRHSDASCSSSNGQDCASPTEESVAEEEEEEEEVEVLQAPPPSSASSHPSDPDQLLMTSGDKEKLTDSGAEESSSGTDLDDSHSNLASASTGYHSIINYGTV